MLKPSVTSTSNVSKQKKWSWSNKGTSFVFRWRRATSGSPAHANVFLDLAAQDLLLQEKTYLKKKQRQQNKPLQTRQKQKNRTLFLNQTSGP